MPLCQFSSSSSSPVPSFCMKRSGTITREMNHQSVRITKRTGKRLPKKPRITIIIVRHPEQMADAEGPNSNPPVCLQVLHKLLWVLRRRLILPLNPRTSWQSWALLFPSTIKMLDLDRILRCCPRSFVSRDDVSSTLCRNSLHNSSGCA